MCLIYQLQKKAGQIDTAYIVFDTKCSWLEINGIKGTRCMRSSTWSSINVYGEYEEIGQSSSAAQSEKAGNIAPFKLACGHSKDHRFDLKQMVLNLATTGAAGFPIWMESHSGNASDKKFCKKAQQRCMVFPLPNPLPQGASGF